MPDVRSEENGALLTALLCAAMPYHGAGVSAPDWTPKKIALSISVPTGQILKRVQTLLDAWQPKRRCR